MSYHKIKSNPGNMTPGIVPGTLDGISYEFLADLSNRIKNEKFEFKPGRRIYIPKPQGGLRPLTIAPPKDKVVQESIRTILEVIYEPIFKTLEVSHGFRPGKSCHTALNQIYTKFTPAIFMIKGDISKCFDEIDHKILMSLLEAKINDRQFTKLI